MSLPIGSIILWSKPAAQLPYGWQVCDGTNGTPDLRNMFIYGASADGEVGASGGGSHDHSRPATTGTGGYHRHTIAGNPANTGNNVGSLKDAGGSGVNVASNSHDHSGISGNTGYDSDHTHTLTGNTGATEILPPYVRLYYVMRVL